MGAADRVKVHGAALASFALGLLPPTGPFALFVGWRALRAINASDGRLGGRALAVAGMALGADGSLLLAAGLLAMLLLPARAAARRAECANNLRLVGLALAAYRDGHKNTYPPAALPLAGQPPARRWSWLAGVLPYLEPRTDAPPRWQALAEKLAYDRPWDDDANRGPAAANVARYRCPGDPANDPRAAPGLTNYVGVAGLGTDAAGLPRGDPRAGFFGYDRVVTAVDLAAGTSHTLAAVETTADLGPWAAGGPPTARGVDPAVDDYFGAGRPFGGCHRGGTQTLYADGSVRFLADSLDRAIFRAESRLARGPLP